MKKTAIIYKFAVFSILSAWSAIYFLFIFNKLPDTNFSLTVLPFSFLDVLNPTGMLEIIANLTVHVDWVLALFVVSLISNVVFRFTLRTNFIKKVFRFNFAMFTVVLIHTIHDNILDTPLFILLIWIIIAWMIVSIVSVFIVHKYLDVVPYLDSSKNFITKADDVEFVIEVMLPRWYKWIPFNWGSTKLDIIYGVEGYKKQEVANGISEETKISVKVGFDYKGNYQIGVYKITLTDTLGIVSKTINYKLRDAKIYPEVIAIKNKMNFAFNGDDEAMKQLIRKGEKFDARLIQPGDSMKRVNWQLFAKQGDIFVRHEEISSFIGSRTIFYDNRLYSDQGMQKIIDEKMTEVLISTVDNFLMNKEEYKLLRFSKEEVIFEKYKLRKFKELVDDISFIPFVKEVSKSHLIQMKKNLQTISRDGDVIIITSNPDKYIFEQCLGIKKAQGNPKVIYVADRNKPVAGVTDFWNKLGVPVVTVNTRRNTKEYREEIL